MHRLARARAFVEPEVIDLPVKRSRLDNTRVVEPWSWAPPDKLAQALFNKDPQCLLGEADEEAQRTFWEHHKDENPNHLLWSNGSFARQPNDILVPIALHGDEGRGMNLVPTLVVTMQSLLLRGKGGWKTRFVMIIIPSSRMLKEGKINVTNETFYSAMSARPSCLHATTPCYPRSAKMHTAWLPLLLGPNQDSLSLH
jgi:hypothetical protein